MYAIRSYYAYKTAVLSWRVKTGDKVKKDDVVCEAEVEKSTIEILSPANGCLAKVCVQDGESCDSHKPIGYIEAENTTKPPNSTVITSYSIHYTKLYDLCSGR